ncbi:MAG TPA: choice-of-anchor Q domain-containing protein [Acidimicrobiia bacterium]|nr:choice-of-anchor Q domain-containing protein [Acidimicrobiia bacterium]
MPNRNYLFVVAVVAALSAGAAGAATFNVDSIADEVDAIAGNGVCATAGGACTLRAAVMEANALFGDDAIQVPAGTYVLTIPPDSGGDADGDLDVTDNLTVTGAGTADTTIDASAMNRMFLVSTGVDLSLASMTLDPADETIQGQIGQLVEGQDGSVLVLHDLTVLPYDGNGGLNSLIRHTGVGLAASSLSWTIDSPVTFFMDLQPTGGAAAVITLDDVSVEVLPAGTRMPSLWFHGSIPLTLEVTNCLLDGTNAADVGNGWVINFGDHSAAVDATIADTEVRNSPRGALKIGNSGERNVDVLRTTLTNVTEQLLSSVITTGSLDIEDSLLAEADSVIQIFGPTTIRNSTIIVNDGAGTFESLGGGLLALHNSTIFARTGETVTMRNSVLTGPCDTGTNIVSEGYNLIADTTDCTITGDTTGNILNVDPELDILADNGGPTDTMHPLAGSLLLDSGNPATPGSGGTSCEATDQRGVSRPQDGTGDATAGCDIGAVESIGVPDPVLDFGDAPWPYPTLAADDGARHRVSTLFLGTGSSAEGDGLPDPDANGDNLDDGLAFLDPFVPGQSTEVEVTVSEPAAFLRLWLDRDQDGNWSEFDRLVEEENVPAGVSSVSIIVPDWAPAGTTFLRARVSSVAMNPTGSAPDGEVEDYKITVLEPPFVRAFPGESRDVTVGGSVVIGGDPAADGGVPPYTFDWTLIGQSGATFSVNSTTIPNPSVTANSVGWIDACLEVTDSMPSMDNDCIQVNIFCALPINQDPSFTTDSGVVDYWAENSVESEEYAVLFGGDVIFHAGDKVVLGDGFRVESGASFAVEIDPNINMGCGASSAVQRIER